MEVQLEKKPDTTAILNIHDTSFFITSKYIISTDQLCKGHTYESCK